MEWTLDQMPLGQEAVVLQIEENSMLGRRMREMGITEGVRICRKRRLGWEILRSIWCAEAHWQSAIWMQRISLSARCIYLVAGGFINRRKER